MFGLSMGEITLILVIALLFIGPKKLPELAKGMGKGIRDFQKALKGDEKGDENSSSSTVTHQSSVSPNSLPQEKSPQDSGQANSNKS